jgi:hypothetical protein
MSQRKVSGEDNPIEVIEQLRWASYAHVSLLVNAEFVEVPNFSGAWFLFDSLKDLDAARL